MPSLHEQLKTGELAVTRMPLASLKRYPNNPRKNEKAVAKVAKSLQRFGWRQPIVVDKDMVIVVGDTRYLAAQSLGLDTVPVHVALDLTDAEARAYRLADNRVGEEAEWDDEKLRQELDALMDDADIDDDQLAEWTAFDQDEIDRLAQDEDDVAANASLAPVSVERQPVTTWILIAIPTVQYGDIAEHIEAIVANPDAFVEMTANGDSKPS